MNKLVKKQITLKENFGTKKNDNGVSNHYVGNNCNL